MNEIVRNANGVVLGMEIQVDGVDHVRSVVCDEIDLPGEVYRTRRLVPELFDGEVRLDVIDGTMYIEMGYPRRD